MKWDSRLYCSHVSVLQCLDELALFEVGSIRKDPRWTADAREIVSCSCPYCDCEDRIVETPQSEQRTRIGIVSVGKFERSRGLYKEACK